MRLIEFRNKYVAAAVVEFVNTTASEFMDKVFAEFKNVQLVNPEAVMDWDVFDAAVVNALISFGTQKQKAKTLANEILIRLAATTQVEEAISRAGLKPNSKQCLFYVVDDEPVTASSNANKIIQLAGGRETDLGGDKELSKIIKQYGIDEKQVASVQARNDREAVKLLVIQKIAATML